MQSVLWVEDRFDETNQWEIEVDSFVNRNEQSGERIF